MRLISLFLCTILLAVQPAHAVVMVGFGQSTPSGYSDSFTGTDDTTLATHDSNWDAADGGSISNAIIKSNHLYNNASTAFFAIYTASTSNTSQAVMKAQGSTLEILRGVTVRAGSGTSGYHFLMQNISGGNYTGVIAYKDGSYLGACNSVITSSIYSDHTLKIIASGTSTVTVNMYVDGSLVCTKTDSTSTITSGNPGVYMGNIVNAGDNSVDDWSDN